MDVSAYRFLFLFMILQQQISYRLNYYSYSKQENLTFDDPEMLQFTHLLMEAKSKYSPNIKPYLKTHDILDWVDGFSHIALNYNFIPPIKIKTKPTIFIMKRKPKIAYDPTKAEMIEEPDEEETLPSDQTEIEPDVHYGILTISDEAPAQKIKRVSRSSENERKIDNEWESSFYVDNLLLDSIEERETVEESQPTMEFFDFSSYESIDKKLEDSFTEKIEEIVEFEKLKEEILKDRTKIQQVQPVKLKIEERVAKRLKIENNISPVLKQPETPVVETHREGSGTKESVKKMIQEKNQEITAKHIFTEDTKTVPNILKPKPIKIELPRRQKSVPDNEIKSDKLLVQNEQKVTNVKESIRNIINQFREFEKDLIVEDSVSLKKWTDNEVEDFSRADNEIGAASLEENINEMDKFIFENQDPAVLNDAKKSLKEIIEQFKELKSELSLDEDDKFDEIAEKFEERPISETLMHFSNALKNLVQRRKEKVNLLTVNGISYKREQSPESTGKKRQKRRSNQKIHEFREPRKI